MNYYEFHEASGIFPLMQGKEFSDLVEDIRANGLRESIWIYQDKIIDGRNRYRACLDANVEPHFKEWDGNGSLISFVVSLNLHRRHLDESQRGMVGARIKSLFEEEAKKRKSKAGGDRKSVSANLRGAISETNKASEQAAEAVNVSARTVESASKVLREGVPELIDAVDKGQVSVSAAAVIAETPKEEQAEIVARGEKEILSKAKEIRIKQTEAKRKEQHEKVKELASRNKALNAEAKKFNLILADPPWPYNSRCPHSDTRFGGGVHGQYPVMTLEEIKALPVPDITTDDAILFLWVTWPHIESGLEVIKAWGFEYKTIGFDWMKLNKSGEGLFFGTGFYSKSNSEPCLLAIKGDSLKPAVDSVSSAILSPLREHSRKPDEVYDRIELMYPDLEKLEMFARQQRPGWQTWGNEDTEPISIPSESSESDPVEVKPINKRSKKEIDNRIGVMKKPDGSVLLKTSDRIKIVRSHNLNRLIESGLSDPLRMSEQQLEALWLSEYAEPYNAQEYEPEDAPFLMALLRKGKNRNKKDQMSA